MPLDTSYQSLPQAQTDTGTGGGFDTTPSPSEQPGAFEYGLYQDRLDAQRGLSLVPTYQPTPTSTPAPAPTPGGYATPQHAGVTAIRGYDPLRTTATWGPDAKPLTQVFNPFPTQATPQQEPGEWNYLKRLGWDTLMKTGDAALGVGRLLNTAIGDMTTQAGGGNEWVEQHIDGWHQAIQGEITDNIKAMGDGHRNAYEGSILRSMGIGPEQDEQGNPIPGVFEGGGGVGRFANYVAARVAELIPMGVAGLVSGGPGAVAMLGAQTLGEQYNATADQVGRTDDKTYQATNPIYRDLRQNQGYTEMQAKQEMLQHAMLAALASAGINMAGAAVGMYGAPAAFSPMLRRVWGAVMGGAGFGVAGGASSAAQQKVMTGDIDVVTAMREALNQAAGGVAMGAIFGAHARERPGEEGAKPPGTPDATTAGVDADAAAALAAAPRTPEQTEMFAPTQMGPTVAPSPAPAPTESTATPQPTGAAPIPTDRTPGPYAPQTYPAYGPEGPTVVSRPEGMPQARQPAMFENIPEAGPSGPIVPPPPGGRAGPGPSQGVAGAPRSTRTPPAAEAAVATSKAKGAGKVTPGVTPTEAPKTVDLTGMGGAMASNMRDMLWQKHQAGEINEGGRPSNILQGSKWLADRGIITDRASFNEFLDAYGAAGDQVRTSAGLNKFVGDYARENAPEAPVAEAAPEAAPETPTPGAAEPAAETPAAPKLTPYQMRQQLIEWGYKRSQVKAMRVADVAELHAKGPDAAPGRTAAETAKPPEAAPEAAPEITLAPTQAEPAPVAEVAEAEKVPAVERETFPATPKEEGPPIAEPLTGRALEKARLAEGKETPVRGEAAVAEREPETVPGEQGRLELPAAEDTVESRRDALHEQVQAHAEQVIQPKGKADIKAAVNRASNYLHDLIDRTDGTKDAVAEEMNRSLNTLPEGTMPGTTTTWRNYLAQMMTRLTGHEPTSAAAERAEAEGVRRTEQARVGAEPARRVSGEDIEQAVAAPTAGEGPEMTPVARKAEADTVTNVKRRFANLIKRMRDGDLTPAEAAAEYDKPVEGEARGAKRSKGYGTFREALQTRLAEAADERAEQRILDELANVERNREMPKPSRDALQRKLMNALKNVGREAASEVQDWLERLDDPVGKAVEDRPPEPRVLPSAGPAPRPGGVDPRASRFLQMTRDPRLAHTILQMVTRAAEVGRSVPLHDLLRTIIQDPLIRNEARPLVAMAQQWLRLARNVEVMTHEQAYNSGRINEDIYNRHMNDFAYQASGGGQDPFIVLNPDAPVHYGNSIVHLLHEASHQVTSDYIEHLLSQERINGVAPPALTALREIGRELNAQYQAHRPLGIESDRVRYALKDEHELHTMMMTDPTVQAFMARVMPSDDFVKNMTKLGFAPTRIGHSLWRAFTNWVRNAFGMQAPASASEYTMLDHVLAPVQHMTEAANRYNERLLPKDPVLRGSAEESYRTLASGIGPAARQTMDTISRVVDYGRLSDARRGLLMRFTPLDRLVERFGDAMPGMHTFRLANEMMRYAGKQFSDKYADEVKGVTRRIITADDRNGLQSLMNDATLNEMHLRPGGDNSHLAQDQQGLLRELRTRYNNLSANDREVYGLTTDLHDRMYQEIRDAQLKSMVNIHMPDADEATTNAFVRAARTREGLDRYVDNTDQAHRDVVKAIADFHKLGYVQGDYFPLRRFGNYVVRYGDRDDLNSYGVEFFENRAKAEARIAELRGQNVPDVYRLDAKDTRNIGELAPSHPAVDTLINRLSRSGFDEQQQNLVREQLNRIMVQQATRSARSRLQQTYRRRGIRGASEDQARALSYDFIANSQAIGHLLWGPARARALGELGRNVDDLSKPGAPDTALSAVTGRTVQQEMARRADRLSDPDNVVHKVLRGVNLFNYLHSLDSLSHMVSSTMEAHTNSVALGGARYGYGRFSMNLAKAVMQLTPKMAATGAKNTFNGVFRELKATDWNLAHIARDRLIAGGAHAGDMNRMFDAAEKAGLIDHTIMTDLRMDAAGLSGALRVAGEGVNRFLILTQAGAHATDVMNKSAIMKAAYDSHLAKHPGDRDGAVDAGIEYARKSMPNYSAANKGSMDRWLGPLLQFKRYGIHMYTLMGNLAREMAHGDNKFEAAKALSGLILTHAMMAGVITTIADPLRYLGGAYDMLTTGKPKDRQAAIRGWLADTFGQTAGEIIGRGIPHAAGIDMRHRVGLENLLELPELNGLDKDSIGQFLLGMTTGATGESLIDMGTAAGKLIHGDLGGFLQGVVPRLVRDPMKAFNLAERGVTSGTGQTVLPPSRLSAGDVAAQALGFQPATVSEFREGRNAALAQREELTSEHSRLEQKWLQADPADRPAVMAEIRAFNADEVTRRWGMPLTMDQLMRAQAAGRKASQSPFGLRLPAKSVQGARYVGRFANIGSPIPAAAAP